MAAHILTVLNQMIESPEQAAPHMNIWLEFAPCADQLAFSDYADISLIVSEAPTLSHLVEDIQKWAKRVQPRYYEAWRNAGQPETVEDWFAHEVNRL